MNSKAFRLLLSYGIAIASTAIALKLTLWLEPLMSRTLGALFYAAIIVSTWYGGIGPGMVSIVLSLLSLNYFFLPPLGHWWVASLEDFFRLSIFTVVALIINVMSANLRESKRKVEKLNRQLQEESADRLKAALNAAQMGMWDWNMVTGEVRWSPEHEQLFGLSPGSFDGRYETFEACIHPDDRAGLKAEIDRSLQTCTPYSCEFRVIWKDGSVHWLEGRGQAFYNSDRQPIGMSGTVMAIDQRKQMELALQEREAILWLFAQYAPAGIAMFDREMRYVMASQRWVTEYNLGSIEALINRSHYEVFPEIPERWRQVHQRCLAGAVEKCEEDCWVQADGTPFWISWEVLPWYRSNQEVGGLIISSINITQRKQAEIALQKLNAELEQRVAERTAELTSSNDRLMASLMEQQHTQHTLMEQAQLLDLAHDTIMTCDLNWVITFWNQGAERMYGWTKAEALGKDAHTLLKAQFPMPLAEIQTILFEQGYWEGEIVHFRKDDDRPLTVASRWVVQKDDQGKPIKILKIKNDITARKQAEQALQQYTAEVEDLYNNAPCGYHSLDAEGWVVRINDTELHWLGYTRDEILGKKKFVELLAPNSQQAFQQHFPRLKEEDWIDNLEFQILHKDGTSRWVSLNATAIRDRSGNFVMTRSTLFDISERHKIDQMKQSFISIVSHELRTPLTSIRGSLGLIAGGIYDRKPEKMKEMIAIAARQSDRLVRLVNDILDLRRLESGQAKLHFKQCQAADLIQVAVEGMRAQSEQSQITLVVMPTTVEVWADADAIVQTLTNLLSNAVKFSPAGSTITIAATTLLPHASTLFSVHDQGRGIPETHLETIFGQFQQVDLTDSREKGGTGLGLAICRTIVELHKGKIWVESVLGQGSTFYFSLPANQP